MHRLATATALLAVLPGCAGLSRSQIGAREGNAAITGIVSLPATGMREGVDPCEELLVRVAHPGAPPDESMGRVRLKLSRGRCLYVASHLPSKTELQVTVAPGPDWKCDSGATPTFVPTEATLRLRDYETATRDFSVRCPAP